MGKKYIHPFYNKFTDIKVKKVSTIKTITVEGAPVGGTVSYLSDEDKNLIDGAEQATVYRRSVQKLLDKFCVKMIDTTFAKVTSDDIRALMEVEGPTKTKTDTQKGIVKSWFDKDWFLNPGESKATDFTVANLIKKIDDNDALMSEKNNLTDEEQEMFEISRRTSSTLLKRYNESRKTIFNTLIPKRVAQENLPIFMKNISIWDSLPADVKDEVCNSIKVTELNTNVSDVSDIFTNDFYRNCLADKDIVKYNVLISGKSLEEGVKIKGINEILNELFQKGLLSRRVLLKQLQNQILSTAESESFVPGGFSNEEEFVDSTYDDFTGRFSSLLSVEDFAFALNNVNEDSIIISKKNLRNLSTLLFNQNNYIIDIMEEKYKGYKKAKYFTLGEITSVCNLDCAITRIIERYHNLYGELMLAVQQVPDKEAFIKSVAEKNWEVSINPIYEALINLERFIGIFHVDLSDIDLNLYYDEDFYKTTYQQVYDTLRGVGNFSNRITAFVTRKPSAQDSYGLTLGHNSLADNVSESKDKYSHTMLFRKYNDEKDYYDLFMAVISTRCPLKYFASGEGNYDAFTYGITDTKTNDSDYERMVFQQLDGGRQIAHTLLADSFPLLDEKAKDIYNRKSTASKEELSYFFNYAMNALTEERKVRPAWSHYGTNFKPAEEYDSYGEFLLDFNANTTATYYKYMSEDVMNELVDAGYIYLFQLTRGGLTTHQNGKDVQVETLRELFSDENAETSKLRISAGANIKYRPPLIEKKITHPKGCLMVDKIDKNGRHLNHTDEFNEIVRATRGMSLEDAQKLYPDVKFFINNKDLIKNKRFTEEKIIIQLHVQYLNTVQKEMEPRNFNDYFNEALLQVSEEEVRILSLDRGERNFATLSVFNGKRELLSYGSLNVLRGNDFHKGLCTAQEERIKHQKARKYSDSIKNIRIAWAKEAASYVYEEFLKHPSVIVLEKLDPSFKSPNAHQDVCVYREFLKALISKLTLFADQYAERDELGSVVNPLVLCNSTYAEINSSLSKSSSPILQYGPLLLVDPKYTSKIDVVTGFFNFFKSSDLKHTNIKTSQKFFSKFDSICYNPEDDTFRFKVTPARFGKKYAGVVPTWELTSGGNDRIVYLPKERKNITVDVSTELKNLFLENDIYFSDGSELKSIISTQNNKAFFEGLYRNLKIMLQLRYYDKNNDFILSPVIRNGVQYDTRNNLPGLPICGDTNGSYMIGQKGCLWFNKKKASADNKEIIDSLKFEEFVATYQQEHVCKPAS